MATGYESSLAGQQEQDLRCIAGIMIPADAEFGMPGADDPIIFADIVCSLGRDLAQVREALAALATLAGGCFAELGAGEREAVATDFLARTDAAVVTLGRVVLQCYYRDDRVLRSLGLEARAPFPLGRKLAQGDLAGLLEPVRARPKLWRDAP